MLTVSERFENIRNSAHPVKFEFSKLRVVTQCGAPIATVVLIIGPG